MGGVINDEKVINIVQEEDNIMAQYVIYVIALVIVLIVLILALCTAARKRNAMRTRNKILQLREQSRPENIMKDEIRGLIRQVKYRKPADKNAEAESCAICCDDFKHN